MTKELERAIRHIKNRADAWAVKEVTDALEKEPCDDAISRQAAFEMAYDMSEIDGEHFTEPHMVVDVEDIQKLPPVTQKSGKWIATKNGFECSECGCISRSRADFCQYCEAKMVEPQKSEE